MGASYAFVYIFVYALAMAFISVTLLGIVFFPMSIVSLMYKAVLLGARLAHLTFSDLLMLSPVLILEGEAFVLAAFIGTIVGLSWIKPNLIYPTDDLTRFDAFRKACSELFKQYAPITILLLISAAVETLIIFKFLLA